MPNATSSSPRSSRNRLIGAVAAALLGATALSGLTMMPPTQPAHAETAYNYAPAQGFADLVDKVMPAVISVEVKFSGVAMNSDSGDGGDNSGDGGDQQAAPSLPPGLDQLPPDSPLRKFFDQLPQFRGKGGGKPQHPEGMAEGSGFIISADGFAVTNNHVVKDATEVTVKTSDGKDYKADVIGTDPKTDLALIKIKGGSNFTAVKFASREPRVGDWVVAVGNPFGLGGSVTTGIVSARGRDIGAGNYDDFLQIDAPINRGNSGGPAFNLDGDVVGINTAIFSPSGGSVGIGFAIPASVASPIIESLKTSGKVTRGWLGVQIQPVTQDIADSLGLKEPKGAIVADVTDGSPALKAGIKTGDTILKVNGEDITEPKDLARKIAVIPPGKSAQVELVRGGKPMTVSVAIGTMPGDQEMAKSSHSTSGAERTSLAALGLDLKQAEDGNGVQITAVAPDSPAADRGLSAGDIIVEVQGAAVANPSDVSQALSKARDAGQKTVLMLVRSGDRQRFVAMPVGKG